MMGYSRLFLLLLLSSCTLAQQDAVSSEQASMCLMTSRFKTYKKYVYQYTTESRNGVVGAASLRNGPRVSCQVEIEVPRACGFVMRTSDCTLSEVSVMDPQGQPVYTKAPGSEAFRAAMEKNPLRFSVEQVTSIPLYPEPDEPVNILNIKRGIVSAFLVPALEDGQVSLMSTVQGQCLTDYKVNARKDIPTDVSLSRDLSQCDQFHSRELANSPLALLQNLQSSMSKMITGTQDCHYQFDNKGKHITVATCTEKHVYLPFSHEDNGISSVVTQELSLKSSKRINNRAFDVNRSHRKPLHFEDPEDKAPVQTKDAALTTLRDLMALATTDQGQKRTSIFYKLVSNLRTLRNETLSQTITEMLGESVWLTWQALLQCGTPECTSALLQAIRSLDGVAPELEALVYGLSLQANPDTARVRDMLSMAQYKQSKSIMYSLANTVKRFHKGRMTPEVTAVSEFMKELLNDCSVDYDPPEISFLVLRVVGIMGQAMQAASPGLISSIVKCARRTDIPSSHQRSAIQAFRLMDTSDEIRSVLGQVYLDEQSPVEKRVAAYLILMKNPEQGLLRDVLNSLEIIRDEQLKSFVVTHLKNIQNSKDTQMHQFREFIALALDDQPSPSNQLFDGLSRNYKLDSPLGSVQSNIIFDATDTLPKEVMLETTLKVFDYNYDIFEVDVEGAGFEPTIDALFGEEGFFPDSFSRLMYWAGDRSPMLRDVLDRITPDRSRVNRQVPQELLKDITKGVQRLMDNVLSSPGPEAIAYLKLMGNEIGYMKTSEMRKMAETLSMYLHALIGRLPPKIFSSLTSGTDKEVFGHYIFMDNAFSLPTASGFPLKFSLAGVFAPGAKGGMTFSSTAGELSFMPSVGLEFITQMGVYVPDYVEAGLEMHTNVYHESSLTAKVTTTRQRLKLSIPAPRSNTQLFSVSNELLSVSSGQTTVVPSLMEGRTDSTDCQPLISGLRICTVVRYSDPASSDQAPYYPLTGETRFAVEIQPDGDVSEYAASLTLETLREGREGRHKVDAVRLTLKAQGDDSTEATASLKYNRNKNTLTGEVVIPSLDVDAGIKLTTTDSDTKQNKLWGVAVDVTNKKIPQLTLIGRTRLEKMKDAMLQLQLSIPSLKADASVTATLNKEQDVSMSIGTVIQLPETSYQQKTSLRYDDDKFEVEMKSDLNSEIQKLIPNAEDLHRQLQQFIDDILDQTVAKTDMKLRHIVTKGIEAGNIWLDKLTAHMPGLATLRQKRSLTDLTVPSLPDKLFLQIDNSFRYQFNKDRMVFSLPLPLGGKKSKELQIPSTLQVPLIDLPAIGLYVPARTVPLPSFTVPPSLDFTVPLLSLAEASAKINSNFYSWEGSISGGNNTVDVPSFIAQYKAVAESPFNLLTYKLEGTGMMTGRADDNLKYLLNNSFSHSLVETSFSLLETLQVTNKLHARANYNMEAWSPVGLHAALYYSAQSTSTLDSVEVSGDGTLEGTLQFGSLHTNSSYTHRYIVHPLDREGKGESTLRFDSPFIQAQNKIKGVYQNSELTILSETNVQKDAVMHAAELNYKDSQLTIRSNGVATVMSTFLSNKVEFGVSSAMTILTIESQADDKTNKLYSMITGSLDSTGLGVNSEGSLTFDTARGLHKVSAKIDRNGLTTSGTNSIRCSPVSFENIFNCAVDSTGASLSSKTTEMSEDSRGELNIEGKLNAEEASLNGVFKGNAYGATSRNHLNIVVNRRALTFTNDAVGAMGHMKTEHSHKLTLSLWTLALHSKTDNFISKDMYYTQDIKAAIKPLVVTFDVTNNLKLYDVSLDNEGHMKVEPVKLNLGGSTKGAYREENNIKHTYEINYEGVAGAMKYDTYGNVLGAQLSHKCELEFAGLSSKSFCEAQITSEPLHLNSTVRTAARPFSLTVDALVDSHGVIHLYGKHTGLVRSQLLVQAEPLALAFSHDSKVSTLHMLHHWQSFTESDSTLEGLLTPSDQALTWKTRSKLNNQAYNQDIRTYNNPEKTGLDFSGVVFTDYFNKGDKGRGSTPEEFRMAGFLRYDKNSDCHIIEIPFIESFPAAFEQLKNTCMQALESLQRFINNLNISQLIADLRADLDRLPMQVKDFMHRMDFDNKVKDIKAKLDFFMQEFAVTIDDLELAMDNLRKNLENNVIDVATKIKDLILTVKDYVKAGHLSEKITLVLTQLGNHLYAVNEKYAIKESLVKALDGLEDTIRQMDVRELTDGAADWLQELDHNYRILERVKEKLSEMRQAVENFDVKMFFKDVKDFLLSNAKYVEQLSYDIPSTKIAKVLESMYDVIVNWIDEYEIPKKLNAVSSYIKDLISRYSLDDKFKDLMDQAVVLIKEFKLEQTVQSMVDALRYFDLEFVHDKLTQLLRRVTSQLRAVTLKRSLEEMNERISSTLKSMREFDYNAFVDETNTKLAELTKRVNEQMKTYELVQKIEAVRDFFREIQSSIFKYLHKLQNTKVADTLRKLKTVIDNTFYNDIKMKVQDVLEDMRQRIINMDIRDEMQIYLHRAIESYSNMVTFVSGKISLLMEEISIAVKGNQMFHRIRQAVEGVMDALKRAEIQVPDMTVPLTDLVIPAFTINLNKLEEISIPAEVSVPQFTILTFVTVPAVTISFNEIKAKIVAIIDDIMGFQIQTIEPEEIFGDLKVLYLFALPDMSFPEITLSEFKFTTISIPKLNMNGFEIRTLPISEIRLPELTDDVCIPTFGKLEGEFTVNSPLFTLVTTGKVENSTSSPKQPQFTATISSNVQSPIQLLEYTFEATAQLEAPRMRKLQFRETVRASHVAFSVDHEASLVMTSSSSEASVKTTAKATTQIYAADLVNSMALQLKSGISANINTAYNHSLEIPSMETSIQSSVKQDTAVTMESDTIIVTGQTAGKAKWSIQDHSDEAAHNSNVQLNINFSTAKLTFAGETDCMSFKSKQTLTAEAVMLSHATVEARCETEAPFVKRSVLVVNGEAHIGDLKASLTAHHHAELMGRMTGLTSNSLEFRAHPYEIELDVKNKANLKMVLPLKLTGKVDLQHDYGIILNSEKQRTCWFALARFNQYKYNHNFTAEHNEMDVIFHSLANGEANFDFLTVPLSIPEMTVPYLEIKTPELRDFSLWEDAGLQALLTTPQQTFDMTLKLHYFKNPETHSLELHLEPVYNVISTGADVFQALFEQYRNRIVGHLKESYNEAKSQYIKHRIDTSGMPPRIVTVPGYKIPILNIQVSSFMAEMPAFSYFVPKEVSTPSFKVPALGFSVPSYTLVLPSFEFPVIHVPESLSEIKLPRFTLPAIKNSIEIPALGNITCDFSFKSALIALNANAGLYNQPDIIVRFGASSASVFNILTGKIDGTTSLTRNRGMKLASSVSLEHQNMEANHECVVSLTKRSTEASVGNTVKVHLPFFSLEMNQELSGSTKTKPYLSFKKKAAYMFNIPLIETVGKGIADVNWALGEASSYVSLEAVTHGKPDTTIMDRYNLTGEFLNEANFYLNADGLRSTVRTALRSNMEKLERHRRSLNNVFQLEMNQKVALEGSLRHVFATVEYRSSNNMDLASFSTRGENFVTGELDLVPLTNLKIKMNIEASQPSSLGPAGLLQSVDLAVSSEKQSFTWTGKEQLASVIHACDLVLSNDQSEVHMDLAGSVEGHLAFLKSAKLPVYQKTLWDVLKFDQVTNIENSQLLKISSNVVYTKSTQGLQVPGMDLSSASGALSATLTASSPVHNVSTAAKVEKQNSVLVAEIKSVCSSTVTFLVYDLSGRAELELDDGVISLNGRCSLIHDDVNVNWQHVLSRNLRMKRQVTSADSRDSRHTLNVDVASPTFVDVGFRYASRKDGDHVSVSSPSCGFLGLHLQRRTPSQLYGKLFSRFLSTPDKDTDILTAKAALRNSQKLNLQTSWNLDVLHDMMEGTKDRIPAMTEAVLKFINKCHTSLFGFDLNRGGLKLKSAASGVVERTHHVVLMPLNSLLNSVQHLSEHERDLYARASESLMSIDVEDGIRSLGLEAGRVLKQSEENINQWLNAVAAFLSNIKFTVPGSEKVSGLELFQRFSSLMEKIGRSIRDMEFTIHHIDVVVNGNDIMDKLTSAPAQLRSSVNRRLHSLDDAVQVTFNTISEDGEDFINYLREVNDRIAPRVDAFYVDVLQSSKQSIVQIRRYTNEYKDQSKRKVQEVYNSMSRERLNAGGRQVISILQSHLYGGLKDYTDPMRETSHIKMSNKRMDIDIPLPFVWRSFSEWPTRTN